MEANKIIRDRRLWIITIILFLLLLTFFDKNNFIDRFKLKEHIRELETQRDYYLQKIAEDSAIIEQLKSDECLEKYAREHYMMKREGEEIFLLEE